MISFFFIMRINNPLLAHLEYYTRRKNPIILIRYSLLLKNIRVKIDNIMSPSWGNSINILTLYGFLSISFKKVHDIRKWLIGKISTILLDKVLLVLEDRATMYF